MQIRFLLGPAGSGKTFRCLSEIREALRDPDGPPLLLLAPRQATFQLERQLLADPAVPGYTRLQILSFDHLARFILEQCAESPAGLLQEEGRVMVLRALLGRNQSKLKIFHATARLPGFAQQLNLLLAEFQRQQLTPVRLAALAEKFQSQRTLSGKLHDAALLLDAYLDWLRAHQLQDANCQLDLAAEALRSEVGGQRSETRDSALRPPPSALRLAGLWLDGFAEMTPQELDLLAAFLPICERATLAFCVDTEAGETSSWLSGWALVSRTFRQCHQRAAALPNSDITIESLKRTPERSRFADSPTLAYLEKSWAGRVSGVEGRGAAMPPTPSTPDTRHSSPLRLVTCTDRESEAVLAAREILRFVRGGGRFREAAVLVRRLADYDTTLRRVFQRYGIPIFLDRREPVAHHPLAELTRYALRLTAFGWRHDDWFGALKTGLVAANEAAIDRLENEALARGWQGNIWLQPLKTADDSELEQSINRWLQDLLPPFVRWNESLASLQRRPTARQLAAALRGLWEQLNVDGTLETWSRGKSEIHLTVLDQMHQWLENVELAFGDEALPVAEWLPVLEAGLTHLTVGVIPPALDQVLIGAIDRSRNPELKLTVLPGWNEGVFPAVPAAGPLLTEAERELLAAKNVPLGPGQKQQIGHERFYAYIACTRARDRLVITCAARNADGQPLNPSPFFDQVRQITGVAAETFNGPGDWRESEHVCEVAAPVLRAQPRSAPVPGAATVEVGQQSKSRDVTQPLDLAAPGDGRPPLLQLAELPALAPLVQKWHQLEAASRATRLSPFAAEKIYGRELQSSVSGLEDFAACPFKFFVARGLGLQERKEFQFDDRDKGSFQHDVLREFHHRIHASGRRWRDLDPAEARRLINELGRELLPEFGGGRFLAAGAARFTGEWLIERLGRLVAALTEWLPQYGFDAERVELGFGLDTGGLPSWRIELPGGRALLLRGRIDRVDLCRAGDDTFAVVVDYKSSVRKLDPTKLYHGLELQLLSYLGVLRNLSRPEKFFGVKQLTPAGVFYVPLNGGNGASGRTRADVLAAGDADRRAAYQHHGRFLADVLAHFDNRGQAKGDQFKFSKNKDGAFSARGNDAMPAADFEALREKIEGHLRDYGRRIFEGEVDIAPFRIGKHVACEHCDFRAGCRFDPWTQPYRELHPAPKKSKE